MVCELPPGASVPSSGVTVRMSLMGALRLRNLNPTSYLPRLTRSSEVVGWLTTYWEGAQGVG
jgi:hypothetical protein